MLLSYFNSKLNSYTDIFEYEYKADVSNLDFNLDIYSIQLKVHILLNSTLINKILVLILSITKVK